ncbi:putative nacht and wd domain protein [Ilyonectria robusta]
MPSLDPALYTIAWIAPLEIEARAALCLFDKVHDGDFPLARGSDYVFNAGTVCGHHIVLATLPPGQPYGTGSAGALAGQVKMFFPNLWFGLLVGVAAGLPNFSRSPPRDIRLGDVLVALPEGDSAGLIAYELGKEVGENTVQLLYGGHVLAKTETVIQSAIGKIKLKAPKDADVFLPYYQRIQDEEHANGFGEKLMRDATRRNELRDQHGIIGLEMEAAGTMNTILVGVIRGVCDYADSYKNKEWQLYAAAMAAAYAKAVLNIIQPKKGQGIEEDKADVKALVQAALSCKMGSWLLIIDNADDMELLFSDNGLSDYLPFNPTGSILFTTRNHEVTGGLDISADNTILLAEMNRSELIEMLQRSLKEG